MKLMHVLIENMAYLKHNQIIYKLAVPNLFFSAHMSAVCAY